MTVRAMVVDDSPTMRAVITSLLGRDPEIEVIGTAHNAHVARQMIRELDPDVLTLDIEMPQMNGLDFLEKIMRLRPMPVVMVSTLTSKGADATMRALEIGAVDCYCKPSGGLREILESDDGTLAETVKQAGRRRRSQMPAPTSSAPPPQGFRPSGRILAVGASTGGVEALIQLVKGFPENCPPTVIVQHMPASFTGALAARLDAASLATVREAEDGMPLKTGHVYVAPGGARHMTIGGSPNQQFVRLSPGELMSGHRPSVDMLFQSVARVAGDKALGVLLTGMGADGAQGMLQIRQAGSPTIAQDEASCVVYGMPRVAYEIGGAAEVLPIGKITRRALELCSL